MIRSIRLLDGWTIGWLIGLLVSVIMSFGGKLHFHAPIGALVYSLNLKRIQIHGP